MNLDVFLTSRPKAWHRHCWGSQLAHRICHWILMWVLNETQSKVTNVCTATNWLRKDWHSEHRHHTAPEANLVEDKGTVRTCWFGIMIEPWWRECMPARWRWRGEGLCCSISKDGVETGRSMSQERKLEIMVFWVMMKTIMKYRKVISIWWDTVHQPHFACERYNRERTLTIYKTKSWVLAPTLLSGQQGIGHCDNHKWQQGGKPNLERQICWKLKKEQANGQAANKLGVEEAWWTPATEATVVASKSWSMRTQCRKDPCSRWSWRTSTNHCQMDISFILIS